MATLSKKPYPGFEQQAGEDFNAYYLRTDAIFQELQNKADALPDGEIVGRIVRFPWADGYAFYLVQKEKPLTLQHIPYMDAWTVPDAYIRGLRKSDIL